MNEKFTPGPWSVEGLKALLRFGQKNDGSWSDLVDEEEYMPGYEDANLIATAPELFEHLLYAAECKAHGCMPNEHWLERANAAIKKARGEQ